MAFESITRAIQGLGMASEDLLAVPRAVAEALDAEWIAFREGGGEWSGLALGRSGGRLHQCEAIRRIDFGILERLPRGRLVRLAGPSLRRIPRFAEAGLFEVLVYIDSARSGFGDVVMIALARSLTVDPDGLEAIVRAWIGLTALRTRIERAEEHRQQAAIEARAACALHDLRHELTVATLELDRVSPVPDAGSGVGFDGIRTAIARARAVCESELESASPVDLSAIRVDELLRSEGSAARAVSGRGDSIGIDVRCEAGLEFPVDRGMLSRIVRNLVLNAIQNSPDGERVRIEAERGPQRQLILRVVDQGRGMSSVDREEFSLFGRSGRGGSGIGSASIAACARRIGAGARVRSRLGTGTCVELVVPSPGGMAVPTSPFPLNPPKHAGTRG